MWAEAAVVRAADWRAALARAIGETLATLPRGRSIDLALLFASADYAGEFPALARAAQVGTGARVMLGCSGQGVIGGAREIEGEPALALLLLSLPGADLRPVRFTQATFDAVARGATWPRLTGAPPDDVNGWLLFADPFHLECERLVAALTTAYPGAPIVGGLASGEPRRRVTHLFLDGAVHTEGAVGVAISGPFGLRTIVAQGALPIGEPWTITGVDGYSVETIGGRRAYEVLVDTFRALPPALQRRAQRNLLVGLAIDESREQFRHGDFLIHNLVGIDPARGTIAISARARIGQTIQFQLRDAETADADLSELLSAERIAQLAAGIEPLAGILCSCNGRGRGMFSVPDHDAALVARRLGRLPLAGFFCNGEIGPVGQRAFIHGFTASLALIVPRP